MEGGSRTYPQRPLQCQGSVYLLVEIDRRTLSKLNSTCLISAQVPSFPAAIPSTSFAVMGSVSQRNADWSNLNAGPIGGSDFRKVGDREAPWSYMILGIGKAPWSLAAESYSTGYERADAELAQVNGVLTANAHGLYDFHPSDNVVVNVDAVNKTIEIDGVTYRPPARPSQVGSLPELTITDPNAKCKAFFNDDNPNSWVVLPSVTSAGNLNDIFYIGGNITNNWVKEMKEDKPPLSTATCCSVRIPSRECRACRRTSGLLTVPRRIAPKERCRCTPRPRTIASPSNTGERNTS